MRSLSPAIAVAPGRISPLSHVEEHKQVIRHSRSLSQRSIFNTIVIGLGDAFSLSLALSLAAAFRTIVFGASVLPFSAILIIPAWWLGAGAAGLLPGWGLSAVEHFRRQVILIMALFCVGTVLMFFTKSADDVSRLSIGVAWALCTVLVPLGRMIARHMLCARGLYGVRTIVFGQAAVVADVLERLRLDTGLGYLAVGVCTDDNVEQISGLPVLGGLDETQPIAPAAIIATSGLSKERNDAVIHRALAVYRNVMILPDLGDVPSLFVAPRDLSGTVGLEISQVLLNPFSTKIKRIVDLFLVLVTMPLWLSLCSFIALAIYFEDRRDPIFKQARAGRGGGTFHTFKFRTMVVDAEAVLQKHLAEDPVLRAEWEANFKLRKDPRITRVGNFLRRTSLDELPQLFNVLNGEMALVGPRPLPVYHLNQLSGAVRSLRRQMRPGLTGLWQVSGRSDAGTVGMARWDPYYVRNWSMWLDIVILVRTIRVVLMGSGAR